MTLNRRVVFGLPVWAVAVMGAMVVVRATLAWAAWDPAWSALTWDDFTRVALAREWAADPFFTIPGRLVWLPAHTWVLGSVFAVAGEPFAGNPMALAAIFNTACVVGAAALVGHAGRVLFDSVAGGVVAFAAILFAPWGWFTGLSGLSEPLWYLAVAGAVAAFVTWHGTVSLPVLAAGSASVALGAALRYEGWFLAAAWVLAVAYRVVPRPVTRASTVAAVRRHAGSLAVAVAPLAVPAAWLVINAARTGDPLAFIAESAATFEAAYGSGPGGGVVGLVGYYPASLVRSAPLLVTVLAAAAFAARRVPAARALGGLVVAHFGLFYLTSVLSLGAFTERFTFTFVLASTPLLAVAPAVFGRLATPTARRAAVAGSVVIAVAVTGIRIADAPQEWTQPPDLLALADALGHIAPSVEDPLVLGIGPGMSSDRIPLAVANGDRVLVAEAPAASAADPPEGVTVWVERLPARVLGEAAAAEVVIGRYHLYGPAAAALREDGGCCQGWAYVTETGVESPVVAGPYMGLEFLGDDPLPGAEARLVGSFDRGTVGGRGTIRLRWLYGHGFNGGRIEVAVRLDGVDLFRTDIAARSHWTDVDFSFVGGRGESLLEVAVIALDGIEPGWGWGRSSTVLVESVAIHRP